MNANVLLIILAQMVMQKELPFALSARKLLDTFSNIFFKIFLKSESNKLVHPPSDVLFQ